LLHPDSQPDDKLRVVAERQMKRLNEILEILTDPQKRLAYDQSLAPPPAATARPRYGQPSDRTAEHGNGMVIRPVPEPGWRQLAAHYWFYILIGVVSVATAVAWYATPRPPVAPDGWASVSSESGGAAAQAGPRAQEEAAAAKKRSRRSRIARAAPRAPTARRAAASSGFDVQVRTPLNSEPGEFVPAVLPAPPPAEAASRPAEGPAAAQSPRPPVSPFFGSWLFTAEGTAPSARGRYRALYIECLLKEAAGEIVGAYRARYKVPDQAISPEVAFRVRGPLPAGNSGRLAWTASDGASGVLEVTLHSSEALGVTWWTTTAGSRPALSSGDAMLIRQAVP
jgi:curved DNA-binding protein CbpA